MKKTIIFILVLSMLFGFVGCQNTAKDNKDTSSQPTVSSNGEQITSKPQNNISSTSDISQPANTQSIVSTVARPEKVTKIYNTKINFEVATPKKDVFYDTKNGNSLPYNLYVPKDYSASKKYPVILFLHGAGEMGTDNETQINGIRNLLHYNADFVSQCILICPQSNEWWNLDRNAYGDEKGTLGSALHLLQKIQSTYSCDKNRIYVTGLSMGGYATWDILERYGDIFAAAAPLCGGGNSDNGAAFKNIPIRIYHGTNDQTVSFSNSQKMYNAIIAAGGNKVKLYALEGYGHDVWSFAYKCRHLSSWLFAQDKVNNPSCDYDYISYFRIVDSNGKAIITEEDITYTDYENNFENNSVTLNIHLSNAGITRLNKAYTTSKGKAFTVYCSTQKIYSFTATKSITDDAFSIVNVFNEDNYFDFLNMIQNTPN